jgi:hypothetical protein
MSANMVLKIRSHSWFWRSECGHIFWGPPFNPLPIWKSSLYEISIFTVSKSL